MYFTFLFTDIEGSTKLAQKFPDIYQDVLEKHNSILRSKIVSNSGIVFQIIGDAFCCAFENAADAVNAAANIQIALACEKWDNAEIRIRIGIHSGKAERRSNGFTGYITLARTARIMSSAHGGQIIISDNTYKLISAQSQTKTQSENESVIEGLSFRDLGGRRLKDVIEPIRLYQVTGKGLREDFPPLNTLDVRPNNLPVQLNSFIGREEEIKHAKELLKSTHLLTLTGSGGAGKTRFALHTGAAIIDEYSNGVWFAELAAITDVALLPDALINTFNLKEEPKKSPEETLTEYLKGKEILLILDNCEHLINECAELAERLLISCPGLKIIATSREALNCRGEQIYRIPPLKNPDLSHKITPENLLQYDSVRLFIERALLVNPDFKVTEGNSRALAEICSQLDGIPLAIELAAARTKILTPEKINERLVDRFSLLAGGKSTTLPRQQTLRALIDWSYDLLNEKEKLLWSRLSVFSDGCSLEAAEDVCSDETLNSDEILDLLFRLSEKSIINYDENKNRYRMLESLKQYGAEKLKASDSENIFRYNHLKYFAGLSGIARSELNSGEMQDLPEILETEHTNMQSAIAWAASTDNKEQGAVLAGNLGGFWEIRGYNSIGIRLLETFINDAAKISKSASAKILLSIGILARNLGEFEKAFASLTGSLEIYKDTGDKNGILSCLNNLGITASDQGNYVQALKYFDESIFIGRETGNKNEIAITLLNLGTVSYHQGNYEQAEKFFEESLMINRETDNKQGIAMCLNNLGSLTSRKENFEKAKKLYYESLILGREFGDKTGIAMCLSNLGNIESHQGNYEQAMKLYQESLAIMREKDDKLGVIMLLNNLGILEFMKSDYEQSQKLFSESLVTGSKIGDKIGLVQAIIGYSAAISTEGELSRPVILLGAADSALRSIGFTLQSNKLKFHKNLLSDLRTRLNNEMFEKYFEEGKKLTLDDAVHLAISG